MRKPTPAQQRITDEQSKNRIAAQEDFYATLRQMGMSEEFAVGIQIAADRQKSALSFNSKDAHLHNHAVIAECAINRLVESIYHVFNNPSFPIVNEVTGDIFSSDENF